MITTTKQILELYEKFLERAPAQSEIDYWNNQINSGLKIDELSQKIGGSKEAYLLKLKKDFQLFYKLGYLLETQQLRF